MLEKAAYAFHIFYPFNFKERYAHHAARSLAKNH
jgi:hypothetical protein